MLLNKINPVLRFLLCVLLCFCLCFSMFILRPVEVKANPLLLALTAVSIFVSFFSLFGWSVEVGDDLGEMMRDSGVADKLFNRIGSGAENLWHFIIGDLSEWHYEKYGYLHPVSEWDGYYIDDNGNLMNSKHTVENPTDIGVGIDWDQYEQDGTCTFNMDTNVYNDIWFEVQEFMHSQSYSCFSDMLLEVSSDPTIEDLRDLNSLMYLGNLLYWTEDNHNGVYASGGIPESDVFYYTFGNYNVSSRFELRNLVYSYTSEAYELYIDFSNDLVPWCLGDNGTTNEFYQNWAVSSPYLVNSSDGNTYYKFYLFNFDENNPVIVPSTRICSYASSYEYYCDQPFVYTGSIIEKYDVLLNPSASSSDDDVIRNSATANQYAGTVNTGDDDGTYTPVTAPGQAGTIPVTGTGSLVNPVTGVNGSDYANGTSVPLTGTVTGSLTITQTDTGVKSEVNSVVSTATVDYPDGFDRWQPSIKLFTKFPFCIPYDLYSCFAILYKDPKELYFEIPFKISSLSLDEKVVIDLRKFDSLVLIVRYLSLIGFVIFLTLKTRDLIKG